MLPPKNDRARPVTKLCLGLETFRRTEEGRVRDAAAFLDHFFPRADGAARDRLFLHVPNQVRADLLSGWGIRGKKSALRDDDEKVREAVADALAAGDVDAKIVEEGVTPEILVDWAPLDEWWAFWRGTALPAPAVRKALALARELALFDERWFLENLRLGAHKGTDVICAALSKEQVVAWLHAVHGSESASPAGLVAALGWETVLAKTAHDALLHALDALARQIGLASESKGTPVATTKAPEIKTAPASSASRAPAMLSRPPPLPSAVVATPSKAPAPPAPAPPPSTPNARSLFGAPAASSSPAAAAPPQAPAAPMESPPWAPPRAEPGDMGWDLVHGVAQPMPNNVTPKYDFGDDDEPTVLPGSRED